MTGRFEAIDLKTAQHGIFEPSDDGVFFRTDFHQVHRLHGPVLTEYRRMGARLHRLVHWTDDTTD